MLNLKYVCRWFATFYHLYNWWYLKLILIFRLSNVLCRTELMPEFVRNIENLVAGHAEETWFGPAKQKKKGKQCNNVSAPAKMLMSVYRKSLQK